MATSYTDGEEFKPFRTMHRFPGSGGYLTHSASDTEAEAWAAEIPVGTTDKLVVRLVVCEPPPPPPPVWIEGHDYCPIGKDPIWRCVYVWPSGIAMGDAMLVHGSAHMRKSQVHRYQWTDMDE